MKLSIGLIVISSMLALCLYGGYLALYTAGTMAAAQHVHYVPYVGPMVENRINNWLLGAHEPLVIDEIPFTASGPNLAPTEVYTGVIEARIECEAPIGWPVNGRLTQGFHAGHNGIDIGVNVGTPVLATHCGRVVTVRHGSTGYGFLVVVANGPYETYYAHNSAIHVKAGDQVERGEVIASSGSTGRSTGPHVHYEVRVNGTAVAP
jgi:hypothetical protein